MMMKAFSNAGLLLLSSLYAILVHASEETRIKLSPEISADEEEILKEMQSSSTTLKAMIKDLTRDISLKSMILNDLEDSTRLLNKEIKSLNKDYDLLISNVSALGGGSSDGGDDGKLAGADRIKESNLLVMKVFSEDFENMQITSKNATSPPSSINLDHEKNLNYTSEITLDDLDNATTVPSIISEARDYVLTHINKQLPDKLNDTVENFLETFKSKMKILKQEEIQKFSKSLSQSSTMKCVDILETLNLIQSSWKFISSAHGDRQINHLSQAKVVYGNEWTSDTYQPSTNTFIADENTVTIGQSFVRKYIPEDWEKFLPNDWQSWDITLFTHPRIIKHLIPSYFYHSLPFSMTGIMQPPEILLSPEGDGSLNIGSCWAMAGSSGKITFQLPYPIIPSDVIVEHFPGLESAYHFQDSHHKQTSAPRYFRLIGYPPCQNSLCAKFGFDHQNPIELGAFEYKIVAKFDDVDDEVSVSDKSSTQYFALSVGEKKEAQGCTTPEKEEEVPSCGSPSSFLNDIDDEAQKLTLDDKSMDEITITALTLDIEENWGNRDFTCLYRVRLHGKTIV